MRHGRTSAALLLLCLLGCAPESIIVARDLEDTGELDAAGDAQVEAGGDDSALPNQDAATGDACGGRDDKECPAGSYCERLRCGERGTCVTPPQMCDGNSNPVCSCDGKITYFNDCLRKIRKVTASTPGECTKPGTGCSPFGRPCPPGLGAVCFVLSEFEENACTFSMASVGKCWIVPDRCPADRSGGERFQVCGPAGPEGECLTSCEAVKSADFWSGSSSPALVSLATRSDSCSRVPHGTSPMP
jgi:hypothetical protein